MSLPELWARCVPDYWIGKKALVQYGSEPISRPEHGRGAYSSYNWQYVGTLDGADSEVLEVTLDPIEHGRLPQPTGVPWGLLERIKLLEGDGGA